MIHIPWLLNWSSVQPEPLKSLMHSGLVLAPLGLHAWVPGAACSLNCPSWSVSVEVFFYAVFPFLLPLVLRRPAAVAVVTALAWMLGAGLLSVAWAAYGGGVSLIGPEPGGLGPVFLAEFIKYFPLFHLPTFVAGLLLCVVYEREEWSVGALLFAALACGVLIVAAAVFVPEPVLHDGLTVLVWAPLILACAAMRTGPLCAAPMIFLGKVSFAFYLLHIPVFAMINTADRVVLHGWLAAHPWTAVTLNGAASLAAATLVHLLVEEPARRWIMGRAPRRAAEPMAA